MNNIEISAYIDAKKKSKIYIENEIRGAQDVLEQMKAQKPVKWYHNFYYVLKRVVFIFLASIAFLFLISTFTSEDVYQRYFDEHYDQVVTGFLNDNFGTHSEITVSQTSATDQKISKTISTQKIREDLRQKLVDQVFDYSLIALQILLALLVIVFWYIARLTRKLHLKNKQILDHYEVNLNLMNLYSEVVNEQNYEIEFLNNATTRKIY